MLVEFAVQDHAKGWVQQYHIGPIRNNNPRLFREAGPDTGFDSIGDQNYAQPLAKFLGRLDDQNQLTKTILYNINPRDNEMLATDRKSVVEGMGADQKKGANDGA